MTVRMGKGMQCIMFCPRRTSREEIKMVPLVPREILQLSISDGSGSDRRRRIISGSRYDLDIRSDTPSSSATSGRSVSYCLIALVNLRHLSLALTPQMSQHFLRPAAIFYIKQQHTGCIRYICTVYAGQTICQIVLRQHNLRDPCKILRLIVPLPTESSER